jgi:hypothetical protein
MSFFSIDQSMATKWRHWRRMCGVNERRRSPVVDVDSFTSRLQSAHHKPFLSSDITGVGEETFFIHLFPGAAKK